MRHLAYLLCNPRALFLLLFGGGVILLNLLITYFGTAPTFENIGFFWLSLLGWTFGAGL